MKKLLFITFLFLAPAAYAQTCPDGACVSQATLNKAAEVADKLRLANEALEKFQVERGVSIAEREAATVLIKGLNDLIATKDRIITEYERINALYAKVIEFQTQIINNLEKQLSKPKSAFQKFMKALKEIALIVAGVAIGRAGI